MSGRRITKGFAWNHLYKIAEYGGVNLYAILVVRKFGPELGGNYAVFLSITGTLAIIGAFAVDGVLLRYLPRILGGEREIGEATIEGVRPFLIELLAFRLFVNLILGLLVVLVLAVLPAYFPSFAVSLGSISKLWPYVIVFLIGQACVAFSAFTLMGLLQVKWVFFASLIFRSLLIVAGGLMLMLHHFSLDGAAALFAFSTLGNGILLVYWVYHHVERESALEFRTEFAHFRRRLKTFALRPSQIRMFILTPFMLYGVTTWGNDLLSTVLGRQPDILMMRALLGENARDIGLYESAARIGLMTEYIFLFGLGGTLVSVFSELAHADERNGGSFKYPRLLQARRDISGFQTVATSPIFAFMLAFSPLVIEVLYGPKFAGAAPMMMGSLILQSLTVIVFGGGMHITSLVVIGKERVVFVNRLSWGVANLVANYFLIQSFGGLGAMIGTQCANCGACATESLFTAKLIGQSLRPARSSAILAIVVSSVLITYFTVGFLGTQFSSLVRLLLAGALMTLLTMGGYIVFRIPEARKVFDKIRSLFVNSDAGSPDVVSSIP